MHIQEDRSGIANPGPSIINVWKAIGVTLAFTVAPPALAQLPIPVPAPVVSGTHGEIEVGWYAAGDVYKYIADVNIGFNFGSWKDATFSFEGGILTLIKTTPDDSFQPDRYRGTLQPSVSWERENNTYLFAIKHQSFHTIDRPPPLEESYELYLVGYERTGPPNLVLTVGRYLHAIDVDYKWDIFAQLDTACIGTCRYGRVYTTLAGHYVKEDGSRGSFLDYNLEVGVQSPSGVRYFGAIRQIHDIDQFGGTTDNQLAVGVKYLW